jgi:hypothetical protein
MTLPNDEELAYCESVVEAVLEQTQRLRNDTLEVTGDARHFLVRELEVTIVNFLRLQVSIGFAREGGEPRER